MEFRWIQILRCAGARVWRLRSLRALRDLVKPRNLTLRRRFAAFLAAGSFSYAMAASRGDGVVVGGGTWCCFVYRCTILACLRISEFVSNDAFLCNFYVQISNCHDYDPPIVSQFPIAMTMIHPIAISSTH